MFNQHFEIWKDKIQQIVYRGNQKGIIYENVPDESDPEDDFIHWKRYEGEILGILPHGSGTMQFQQGSLYEGSWHLGHASGKGKFYYADEGSTYIGTFEKLCYEGFGVKYSRSGMFLSGLSIAISKKV